MSSFLIWLILVTACGHSATIEHRRKMPTEYTDEHNLIIRTVYSITYGYYQEISYQSLIIGAAQGLENMLGPMGLIQMVRGELGVVSPWTGKPYALKTGTEYDTMIFMTEIFSLLDLCETKYRAFSRKDIAFAIVLGMISTLDERSELIMPVENQIFSEDPQNLAAIGLFYEFLDVYPRIIATSCRSPAHEAGLKHGDLIIKIEGKSTQWMDRSQFANQLPGKIGTKLEITIKTVMDDKEANIILKRAHIEDKTVYVGNVTQGYAHIWIRHLSSGTKLELLNSLAILQKEYDLKGIVLDLRYNGGGLLEEAIGIADLFMDSGTIATLRSRVAKHSTVYEADSNSIGNNLIIAVLVNHQTSSGAEIITAALQDHKLAVVLGTPTFGDRSIQSISYLPMGYALKITTAHFLRPTEKGKKILSEPVMPDIMLKANSADFLENLCRVKADAWVIEAIKVLR